MIMVSFIWIFVIYMYHRVTKKLDQAYHITIRFMFIL